MSFTSNSSKRENELIRKQLRTQKHCFVSRDEYQKLQGACPDQEWKTVFALARYGGLRCPSELANLRWSNILWDRHRLFIESPKLKGQGRFVPLFPDVKQELENMFKESDGGEYVINKEKQLSHVGTLSRCRRIVENAGLSPIKRIFDEMRNSRHTEIRKEFGAKYAYLWLGIGGLVVEPEKIMEIISDADFQRAAEWKEV